MNTLLTSMTLKAYFNLEVCEEEEIEYELDPTTPEDIRLAIAIANGRAKMTEEARITLQKLDEKMARIGADIRTNR